MGITIPFTYRWEIIFPMFTHGLYCFPCANMGNIISHEQTWEILGHMFTHGLYYFPRTNMGNIRPLFYILWVLLFSTNKHT